MPSVAAAGEPRKSRYITTKDGLPDLRIKENRVRFLPDESKRLNGKPDSRLLVNRPDLVAYKKSRFGPQE